MDTIFTITFLELLVGGGGRLLEVGPGTVRMILFSACLCVGLVVAFYRMRKAEGVTLSIVLVSAYLLVHTIGVLIGVSKGNSLDIMMTEIQLTLYWLAAPFLALALRTRNMVVRASFLVKVAGLFLAVVYIGTVSALFIGAIDYDILYATLSATQEFAFRGGGFFFYKGFLYLGISIIFFVAMPKRFSAVWIIIVVIALSMTLTRGFMLSTAFAVLLLLIVQGRWMQLGVALAVATCVAFFIWGYIPSQDESIGVSRDASNSQRADDFTYIVENFKIGSIFFGEGIGTLINERINIENTFLWAFWRLGILGVLFWFMPLVLSFQYFSKIKRHNPQFRLACAYFFSTVLIYVQTMSNPYLNNPIGLSFVLVAIFSLRTLAKADPQIVAAAGALVPAAPAKARRAS